MSTTIDEDPKIDSTASPRRRRRRWVALTIPLVLLLLLGGSVGWAVLTIGANQQATERATGRANGLSNSIERLEARKAKLAAEVSAQCLGVSFFSRGDLPDLSTALTVAGRDVRAGVEKECPGVYSLLTNYFTLTSGLRNAFSTGECEQDAWANTATVEGIVANTTTVPIDIEIPFTFDANGASIGTTTAREFDIRPGEIRRFSGVAFTGGHPMSGCTIVDFVWWPSELG